MNSDVLIVDDSRTMVRLLTNLLEGAGYRVASAGSGEEALTRVGEVQPHLILLDLVMPGMDGVEACRRLKQDPAYQDIPVLMLTSKADPDETNRAFEAGVVDYVLKTFNHFEVLARVRTHLDFHRARRALESKNAELVRLNAEKDRFLGMAAHDLRGPIGGVQGLLELMRESPAIQTDESLDTMARMAHETCTSVLGLVGDLLDFNALERGQLVLQAVPVNLREFFGRIEMVLGRIAAGKSIRLHYTDDLPDAAATAWFDPRRIEQVVANLLTNAIKFSPRETEVSLRVGLNDLCLTVSVRDQGPGIPLADQQRLFREFARTKNQPTAGESSHGLGLAICKRIVECHGGEIGVESVPGQGACFRFRLPLRAAREFGGESAAAWHREVGVV